MRKGQFYYYGNMTPFAALGLGLLALGAFFLTLPILIGAFVVFGAVGAYVAWRLTRAIKRAEEEMLKHQQEMGRQGQQGDFIIDITPQSEEPNSLDHERF